GLREGELVDLHEEVDDPAALAAAEAVERADARPHVEARALLVVEGAEALHRPDPSRAERHVVADDVRDVRPRLDLVDVRATDQASHVAHPKPGRPRGPWAMYRLWMSALSGRAGPTRRGRS